MNNTQEYHYVYKITNHKPTDSRKYYIGVRTCKGCLPENDAYMGSSIPLKESIDQIGNDHFSKEILSIWKTRKLANQEEIRLHHKFNVSSNNTFYNLTNATSEGFCNNGHLAVIDKRDNTIKNVSIDEFKKHSFYTSYFEGTVLVIDKRDNSKKRVSTTEYKKYDYFVSPQNGMTKAINLKSNKIVNCTIDELRSNQLLSHFNNGKVAAVNKITGKTEQISVEKFKNDDTYGTFTDNKVTVKDTKTDKSKFVTVEEFKNDDTLESFHKDKVLVKTKDGFVKVSKKEFENGSFEGAVKNTIPAIDTRDGSKKRVSKKEYNECEYYVNPNAKKVLIFNDKDELVYTVYGSFNSFCEKNGLPAVALGKSYRNNTKLYETAKQSQITLLKKKGLYQFKSWYARIDN